MASFSPTPLKTFFKRGEPMIWLSGLGFSAIGVMVIGLFLVIFNQGVRVFWPKNLQQIELTNGSKLLGEYVKEQININEKHTQLYKVGNRDLYSADFRWIKSHEIKSQSQPAAAIALERQEYGNFYGFLETVTAPGLAGDFTNVHDKFAAAFRMTRKQLAQLETIKADVEHSNALINDITSQAQKAYYAKHGHTRGFDANDLPVVNQLRLSFQNRLTEANDFERKIEAIEAQFRDVTGQAKTIKLMAIVRFYQPNAMGIGAKIVYYGERIQELLFADPRESNTEGGLFPAIFGTVSLIIIMSVLSFPLGVLAGIYLHEYAKDGWIVRAVRIAVNNLASIPAIVFGIFGLGFFVYGIGSLIDEMFFAYRLPEPTFGTGGILWASMTLGLLTIPVVIVATEEALSAIPRAIRENSFALGATKFQTLCRICLPAASPGIMTGFILAMARAAGEVAPLMITGVVKMAPSLAIDSEWPYFHAERKFMHLGFHIYDISFQSPNVEAATPMVYVTTLLLISIVVILSGLAIFMRERLKKKFKLQNL